MVNSKFSDNLLALSLATIQNYLNVKVKTRCMHGMSHLPEYRIWVQMKQRCFNPNNPSFKNYGGRWISVGDEFLDFTKFMAFVGSRPSTNHTLERIDNSLGYRRGNVKWATRLDQSNNRRMNIRVMFHGNSMTVSQLGRKIGLEPRKIYPRIRRGWAIDKSITEPFGPSGSNHLSYAQVNLIANSKGTQSEIAKKLGIHQSTVSRIKNGKRTHR